MQQYKEGRMSGIPEAKNFPEWSDQADSDDDMNDMTELSSDE